METFKRIIFFFPKHKNLLVLIFFVFAGSILFYQFFVFGKIPVPADILIGHYHPLKDKIWQGREAGYPVKNFLLFDGIRQTFPWRILAIEQLKQGRIPFWNPYNLGGTPLLANLQTAAFYPLNFLFFVFEKYTAWGLYLFFQPVLAGFFAYLLFKSFNLSFTSSFFGAVCFAFSGMMLNHLEFGIDGHSSLWLPLMLYGTNLIFKNDFKKGFLVLLIASVFNLTAGYPPPIVYNFLALILWTIFKLKESQKPRCYFLTALAVFFAFLITSPQNLPALELVRKVERRPEFFGEQSGETHFLPYENLLMSVAPDFFGHPSTGNFFSKINYTDSPYIGFWGLSFALLGILLIKRKEVIYGVLILAITLVLMLPTPLAEILRKTPFSFISSVSPMRMLWQTGFALSLLASFGFDSLFGKVKTFLPRVIILLGTAFLEILVCWHFSKIIPRESQILVSRRNLILPSAVFFGGSLAIIFIFIFPRFKKLPQFLFIFLTLGELLRQGIKYNPFVEKELIYPQTEILNFLSERPKEERVLITHQELLPANANIPYKYSMIDGYYSIYDGRVGQLASLANAPPDLEKIGSFPRIVYLSDPSSQIIDLLGARWILALEEQKSPKLKLALKEGKTLVYKNEKSFPKAFFVDDYLYAREDLDIAQKMLNNDLRKIAILERNLGKRDFSQEGEIKIASYKEGELVIDVEKQKEGLLVVVENYDPGWKAYIDGQKAEILRTNYNLMGLVVPSGKRKIIFKYHPFSFDLGVKLSFASFLGLLIFLKLENDQKANKKNN